ncbi:uncharacterized protein LOC128209180 isoform X2 [Mya arenaria]|uniref:uncharacterized protein LOC128209180 isoform X2 n=1 Tax=Mya arenaria TaxID=6604 RepID=UPI0022E2A0DE|nr:uncharacterized protein LOC128209180 isoform X2 [Mya arenaria]
MEMEQACETFKQLMSSVSKGCLLEFLLWTKENVNAYLEEQEKADNTSVLLDAIREDIREALPVEATTSTENILQPITGANSDCEAGTTIHVDAFLYNDDAVDGLVEQGQMSRNYCANCLSRNVKPLTFITHSASVPQIKYMFQFLLSDLRGKTVVDVGSRTGAVLYGAFLYSEAQCIYGIEIDTTFCQLQQGIVEKYNMMERVKVLHSDVLNQRDLLQTADVLILNNVFEFFMPAELQKRIWQFLYETVRKKGTVLITVPSIEETLSNVDISLDLLSWLSPVDTDTARKQAVIRYFSDEESSDLDEIFMYKVI